MSRDLLLLIILLGINFLTALFYLIGMIISKRKRQGLLMFFFMLVFPVVGALFLFFSWLFKKIAEARKGETDLADLTFSQNRMKLITDIDVDKKMNTVPIEEALMVANRAEKRSSFIDILKDKEYSEAMGQVQHAVEDEDPEISHYAAVFVTNTKAKFKQGEADLRNLLEDSMSPENCRKYMDYMLQNLEINLFSDVELKVYAQNLDHVANTVFEDEPGELKDETIALLAELWKRVGDEEHERSWIEKARVRVRKSLVCFKLCAEYYYRTKRTDELNLLLANVKQSQLVLDNEALSWARFFQEESSK